MRESGPVRSSGRKTVAATGQQQGLERDIRVKKKAVVPVGSVEMQFSVN